MENLKLLFQIYVRPAFAMSEIMDRGSWLFAASAVMIVSMAFYATIDQKLYEIYAIPEASQYYQSVGDADVDTPEGQAAYELASQAYQRAMNERQRVPVAGDRFFQFFSFEPTRFYEPILLLSVFYVPASILLMSVFGGIGNFGIVLRRDYATLAICTLSAWAAAHLQFALAGIGLAAASALVQPAVYFALWAASGALFGFFMVFALRTALGATWMAAILTVALAWLSLSLGMYVLKYVTPWLFSPFLLFWVMILFGGVVVAGLRGFGNTFRQRQNFKRFLHNATVNPRDADAHVQLGLIYLERRQETRAFEHLKKAIEIDPLEIDANYELGKKARRDGDLQKAIEHFSNVVEQNDKHALSEVWREIGATYLDAGMLKEAREALEKFVSRRSFDAEGLYYLGRVLKQQGEMEKAREMFEQAIDSAKTSPEFGRRSDAQHWGKLAKREL
jgi:tetratricopeptide (TPR) repeat protein